MIDIKALLAHRTRTAALSAGAPAAPKAPAEPVSSAGPRRTRHTGASGAPGAPAHPQRTAAAPDRFRTHRPSRWRKLAWIWVVFLLMGGALFAERSGVGYARADHTGDMLDRSETLSTAEAIASEQASCLVLVDSAQYGVSDAREQFDQILLDMKIATDVYDLAQTPASSLPSFAAYSRAIVLMPNLDGLSSRILQLTSWVKAGGSLMLGMTPEVSSSTRALFEVLGIADASGARAVAESVVPDADFMAGGGQRYEISDPFDSALAVTLAADARVRASTGDAGVPLIWQHTYGSGNAVVANIGIYDRVLRGFYASAVSLMGGSCAWPVINSAVFFLDDFPSPVPSGDGTYIKRDYGLSIADFYAKVWWPDLTRISERYNIRFTGVMIENYEADTDDDLARQQDEGQFRYFGGLLLRQDGELGYHGYNHQPLCLSDTDYGDTYAYHTWKSADALVGSLTELVSFQRQVLPGAVCSVYVPPSNILSSAGRALIAARVPQIRTIASTYFEDGTPYPYVQEFGVSEDGIVEEPRIVSGSMAGDTFMRLAAVSELNMHFVSTHFMHPDDLLDPDRGAAEGWEAYKAGLVDYLDWLTEAAPSLREQTASECAASIQRFSSVTVSVGEDASAWTVSLGNFHDEAWLLFRANDATPGAVEGGELTQVAGDLYLLHATSDTVRIARTGV